MSLAPRFRRDSELERRLLWGMVAIVTVVGMIYGVLVYLLGTSRPGRSTDARPAPRALP